MSGMLVCHQSSPPAAVTAVNLGPARTTSRYDMRLRPVYGGVGLSTVPTGTLSPVGPVGIVDSWQSVGQRRLGLPGHIRCQNRTGRMAESHAVSRQPVLCPLLIRSMSRPKMSSSIRKFQPFGNACGCSSHFTSFLFDALDADSESVSHAALNETVLSFLDRIVHLAFKISRCTKEVEVAIDVATKW